MKAISLVPDNCLLLLKFDNFSEFSNALRNKSLAWQDLRAISALNEFEKHLVYFDSLVSHTVEFSDLAANNPVYFSVYPGRQFLITLNLKELSGTEKFSNLFIQPPGTEKLKTMLKDGIIGISSTEALLESLFNSSSAKLIHNKNFTLLDNAVDYSGTSIYIGKAGPLPQSYSSITIKPESISLNGLSLRDSSVFRGDENAKPVNTPELLEKIPLVCNAFEAYAITTAETVFGGTVQNDWWNAVNEDALFNAKKQFYENITEYMINVSLPSKNSALILHLKDSSKLAEIIPFMTDTTLQKTSILKLRDSAVPFTGSTFAGLKLPEYNYIVPFSNYFVLATNPADAEIFVNAYNNHSSILQDNSFKAYSIKNLDTEFSYLNYFLANAAPVDRLLFGEFLSNKDFPSLKNLSHCSYSSTFKKNFINYRLHLKYFQEDILNEPNVLWTLNTDTTIITRPAIFKDHISNGNEIAFQTITNDLFLQNATGKTLWKKKLQESIRSEIFVVDAFKNGKYQMLFNTDHYIHLVDRNGNYVQGYPVKLPSKATNKLCVFDYENKNDLRLFIACADNKIYNYTIWGLKNEGFKPPVTSAEVIMPVKYCKVGLSDYLITADRKGKIYAFSRKGDGRIDFKNKLIEDAATFELEEGNLLANTQLVYFDEKNNIINKISLIDKKEVFKTGEKESQTLSFADFDGNKITDALVSSPGKLEVFDLTGNKIFAFHLPIEHTSAAAYYQFNNSRIITGFDKTNSKVYTIDVAQQNEKVFDATQPALCCDLFRDGKPYLLVVAGSKLKCVKL